MKLLKIIGGILLLAGLAACGGGGGSAGTPGSGGGTTTPTTPDTTTTVTVSDVVFELSKTTILNSGSDVAQLTVTVLDANRNALPNIAVQVALSPDGIFLKTNDFTDANGQYVGSIGIGGNKSNRTINATIKAGSLTKNASVLVSGSQIALTPVPATPTPGQTVTLNVSALDSANGPLQNLPLALTGPAGIPATAATDVSGNAEISFVAPAVVGTYTVVVSGAGTSVSKILEVVASGAPGKPAAVGPVSSASLTPVPTTIKPNTIGQTTNRSRLQAKFLTTGNTGIENMRVRFAIVAPALGNGEKLSAESTIYSDSSGLAQVDYIAGTRSSPTNGVVVVACYSTTTDPDCTNSTVPRVTATLTVAGDPLSISIGDNNLLEKGLGDIAYIKKFLIQINDASGVAVSDAIVSVSTDITHYGKGIFSGLYPFGAIAPTIADGSLARTSLSSSVLTTSTVAPSTVIVGTETVTLNVWCANEDGNRNGFLDAGEDVNGDGSLQPRKAEIIVSYVNGNRTDANGQLLVQVSYSQNMGRWLAYTLRATTSVAGSEGDASKSYITDVLESDVANGSFLTPPFGTSRCSSRN